MTKSKLNQVIAVLPTKKQAVKSTMTKAYHLFQKPDKYSGLDRTYQPRDDDGDTLAPENKKVERKVNEDLDEVKRVLVNLFDVTATQEYGNAEAKATELKVGDKVLMMNVPVTYLLFLEKQLVDIRAFVGKLPTLDTSIDWTLDPNSGTYKSSPVKTTKTKKTKVPLVLCEATKEHPAQVTTVDEDQVVGDWTKVDLSGAISVCKKDEMLNRVDELAEAVKRAREEANSTSVENRNVGDVVLNHIFG